MVVNPSPPSAGPVLPSQSPPPPSTPSSPPPAPFPPLKVGGGGPPGGKAPSHRCRRRFLRSKNPRYPAQYAWRGVPPPGTKDFPCLFFVRQFIELVLQQDLVALRANVHRSIVDAATSCRTRAFLVDCERWSSSRRGELAGRYRRRRCRRRARGGLDIRINGGDGSPSYLCLMLISVGVLLPYRVASKPLRLFLLAPNVFLGGAH